MDRAHTSRPTAAASSGFSHLRSPIDMMDGKPRSRGSGMEPGSREGQQQPQQQKPQSRLGLVRSATVAGTRALRRPFTSSGPNDRESAIDRQKRQQEEDRPNNRRASTFNGGASPGAGAIQSTRIREETAHGAGMYRIPIRNGLHVTAPPSPSLSAPTTLAALNRRSNSHMNSLRRNRSVRRMEMSIERRSKTFPARFDDGDWNPPSALTGGAAVVEITSGGNMNGLARSRSKWNPFSRSKSRRRKASDHDISSRQPLQAPTPTRAGINDKPPMEWLKGAEALSTTTMGEEKKAVATTEDAVSQDGRGLFLSIDIPTSQLERYSVMFAHLLDEQRPLPSPPQKPIDDELEPTTSPVLQSPVVPPLSVPPAPAIVVGNGAPSRAASQRLVSRFNRNERVLAPPTDHSAVLQRKPIHLALPPCPSLDYDDEHYEKVEISVARQVSVSRRPRRMIVPLNSPTSPAKSGRLLETKTATPVVHLGPPEDEMSRKSTLVVLDEV